MKYSSPRQHMADLCRQLSAKGYFAGTGGNIMLRLDDQHVAVTPSATDYQTLEAADICILSLRNLAQLDGSRAPSVESSLHASVLRQRADLGCSIHTHQPVASACALLGKPLAVPDAVRALLGNVVPVVGYAPSGTALLAHRLKKTVRTDCNAYLMRNHGILCGGADIDTALRAVDALETVASDHLTALIRERAGREDAHADQLNRLLGVFKAQSVLPGDRCDDGY